MGETVLKDVLKLLSKEPLKSTVSNITLLNSVNRQGSSVCNDTYQNK